MQMYSWTEIKQHVYLGLRPAQQTTCIHSSTLLSLHLVIATRVIRRVHRGSNQQHRCQLPTSLASGLPLFDGCACMLLLGTLPVMADLYDVFSHHCIPGACLLILYFMVESTHAITFLRLLRRCTTSCSWSNVDLMAIVCGWLYNVNRCCGR